MTDANDPSATDTVAQDSTDGPDDSATSGRPIADGDPAAADVQPGEEHPEVEAALTWRDIERKLKLGAIGVLGLLAVWATFQVYVNTSRAIGTWFSRDFVPVFQAAFNLMVVLVAIAGILYLLRELS